MRLSEQILNDIINEASSSSIPIKSSNDKMNNLDICFSTKLNNKLIGENENVLEIKDYNSLIESMERYFNTILNKNILWTSIGVNNLDNLKKNPNDKYRFLHDNFVFSNF